MSPLNAARALLFTKVQLVLLQQETETNLRKGRVGIRMSRGRKVMISIRSDPLRIQELFGQLVNYIFSYTACKQVNKRTGEQERGYMFYLTSLSCISMRSLKRSLKHNTFPVFSTTQTHKSAPPINPFCLMSSNSLFHDCLIALLPLKHFFSNQRLCVNFYFHATG